MLCLPKVNSENVTDLYQELAAEMWWRCFYWTTIILKFANPETSYDSSKNILKSELHVLFFGGLVLLHISTMF